jgi:hypothetical protein
MEFVKRIAGSSARIRKMRVRILWKDRSPPKRKKRLHIDAIDVRALTILGAYACTDRRKMVVIHLDRLVPYQGAVGDERP